MASQINGISITCRTVCSCADQRKHQSSTSVAFVRGTTSNHKRPVTRKMFSFDGVIMKNLHIIHTSQITITLDANRSASGVSHADLTNGSFAEVIRRRNKIFTARLQYRISIRKSFQTQIVRNLVHPLRHFSRQIVLKICTEHGNITAVLYAKFDGKTETISYGQTRFDKIWVQDGFQYCESLQLDLTTKSPFYMNK